MSSDTTYLYPPRPTHSLEGRVAIVTGAGSQAEGIGNGRAASILLAESGATVLCTDINLSSAQATAQMINDEFPNRGLAVKLDVTNEEECKNVVQLALDKYGRLDILVNNVGLSGPGGSAVEVDPAKWAQGLEINVTSMMLMTKYAVPAMEKNERHPISGRGSIINISSVAGLKGGVPMLLYPTSKGAIINMTRAMAAHHGPSGIRVNCVCPDESVREARRESTLLKTEGNGWDCGCAVRFLASDEARWITGHILPVDAGDTAAPNATPGGGSLSPLTLKAAAGDK
ncbi:hypothetical protein CVT24_009268 [Panaeolus cyanescens]|uniref:Uncharacterized protein n=1 Tax=Panaeolus cyanescens TaxID=181874 RepID=A0A409Y828_9AGAR|nr:hypothetical protein CVT24_009268 [Panaeolus cyanescens]